jgi:2-aminoethylphosphonate-pyruvate transaminase
MVIYPGKVTNAQCFRVGHIGHIFPDDTRELIGHMRDVFGEMGVKIERG